jgi:hypothetical protein
MREVSGIPGQTQQALLQILAPGAGRHAHGFDICGGDLLLQRMRTRGIAASDSLASANRLL